MSNNCRYLLHIWLVIFTHWYGEGNSSFTESIRDNTEVFKKAQMEEVWTADPPAHCVSQYQWDRWWGGGGRWRYWDLLSQVVCCIADTVTAWEWIGWWTECTPNPHRWIRKISSFQALGGSDFFFKRAVLFLTQLTPVYKAWGEIPRLRLKWYPIPYIVHYFSPGTTGLTVHYIGKSVPLWT